MEAHHALAIAVAKAKMAEALKACPTWDDECEWRALELAAALLVAGVEDKAIVQELRNFELSKGDAKDVVRLAESKVADGSLPRSEQSAPTRPSGGAVAGAPEAAIRTREAKQPKGPLHWRVLRLLLSLLFVVCAGVGGVLFPAVITGVPGTSALALATTVGLLLGSATLLRPVSRKALCPGIGRAAPQAWSLALLALSVVLSFLDIFGVVPAWAGTLSVFLAFCLGLAMLLDCKVFRWTNHAIVALATALVFGGQAAPDIGHSLAVQNAKRRAPVFTAVAKECAPLLKDEVFFKAIRDPDAVGNCPLIDGGILVLLAQPRRDPKDPYTLRVSDFEWFIPPDLLAGDPCSVRWVLVLGPLGPEGGIPYIPALAERSELIAPVILLAWPDKRVAYATKLRTGRCAADDPGRIWRATGRALVDKLVMCAPVRP